MIENDGICIKLPDDFMTNEQTKKTYYDPKLDEDGILPIRTLENVDEAIK